MEFSVNYLVNNVNNNIYLYYTEGEDYLAYIKQHILLNKGNLIGSYMLPLSNKQTDSSVYDSVTLTSTIVLPENGIFYVVGNNKMHSLLLSLYKSINKSKKHQKIYVYGIDIKLLVDDINVVDEDIIIYSHSSNVNDFKVEFPIYNFEINNYIESQTMNEFYALSILYNVYQKYSTIYNASEYIKQAKTISIYGRYFNDANYYSQSLVMYKIILKKNSYEINDIFSPSHKNDNLIYFDNSVNSSSCSWKYSEYEQIYIGIIISENNFISIVNHLLLFMNSKYNPLDINNITYYLIPESYYFEDKYSCVDIYDNIKERGINYVFALPYQCFDIFINDKDILIFFEQNFIDMPCQENVFFLGGIYTHYYEKIPAILHYKNITSYVLIGTNNTFINKLFDAANNYLQDFFAKREEIHIPEHEIIISSYLNSLNNFSSGNSAIILLLKKEQNELFIKYISNSKNLLSKYTIFFVNADENSIMNYSPPFDIYIISFYSSLIDNEENVKYKRMIFNKKGNNYSDEGEIGYLSQLLLYKLFIESNSVDPMIIKKIIINNSFETPEGILKFGNNHFTNKYLYVVKYTSSTKTLSMYLSYYLSDGNYPFISIEYNNLCTNNRINNMIDKYEIILYCDTYYTNINLKEKQKSYELLKDIIAYSNKHIFNNKFYLIITKILFPYTENLLDKIKEAVIRPKFLGLFFIGSQEFRLSIHKYFVENNKLIMCISPVKENECLSNVIYFGGICSTVINKTMEKISIKLSGMINNILVVYHNNNFYSKMRNHLINELRNVMLIEPTLVISDDEILGGYLNRNNEYNISYIFLLIPDKMQLILQKIEESISLISLRIFSLFYLEDFISYKTTNIIYISTFSKELTDFWISDTIYNSEITPYQFDIDYNHGDNTDPAHLYYAVLLLFIFRLLYFLQHY